MLMNSEFGQDLLVIHDPSQIKILQSCRYQSLIFFLISLMSVIDNLCLYIYYFSIYNCFINLVIFWKLITVQICLAKLRLICVSRRNICIYFFFCGEDYIPYTDSKNIERFHFLSFFFFFNSFFFSARTIHPHECLDNLYVLAWNIPTDTGGLWDSKAQRDSRGWCWRARFSTCLETWRRC